MRNRVSAPSFRLGVLASAVGSAFVVGVTPQTAVAQGQQADDEITVTGTRIRREDYTAVTATQTITAEDMTRLGLVSAQDMIAQLPSNVGTFQLDGDGGTTSFNVGATLANLRGMNTALGTRTLVLVDGRRQVQTNNGGGVDLSFIPSILISRMETVTGGASAVYGSDATAGVVNVILDRNVDGLRVDASFGQNKNGDLRNYSVSVASGLNVLDGRGALTMSVERQVTDPAASCGELYAWCAKSPAFFNNTQGSQLYRINPDTGVEEACGGGGGRPACTSGTIIAPRSRLFPDENLTQFMFLEGARLMHEATTNGSLHTPGPRRENPPQVPTAEIPNPLQGHSEPTADVFWTFNDDGNDIEPFQESLEPKWREYAYGGDTRRVIGGEGPLSTFGNPTRSGQERQNIFANFRWEATDDINVNTRLTYGRTEGESIQNAPRNMQGDFCVFLPMRQTLQGTTSTTTTDDTAYDPSVLQVRGVNGPHANANTNRNFGATGIAEYDGNPAYAGQYFQILNNPGTTVTSPNAVLLPNGQLAPPFVRRLGPANGFLDPRAPNPISAQMRQVIMDRSLAYSGTVRGPAPGPGQTGPLLEGSAFSEDPYSYTTCSNTAGLFGSISVFPLDWQGISINKNIGDWVDRRVTSDTDSASLGLSADGPLFGFDRWTWDGTLQVGTSEREQIRYDIQRGYRYLFATDAVYDPEAVNADGSLGAVVCRINASATVGGEDMRQLFRNYIVGLGSSDVYWSSLGATSPPGVPGGPRLPISVQPGTLAQGQQQLDYLREGCQPLNPFGRGFVAGNAADEARQRAAIDFAFGDQTERSDSTQVTASFSVSGELWKGFGAGPVRMAAGIDYRDNLTKNRNDSPGGDAPIVKADFGTQYGDPWNGLTTNYEVFSEFELPLVRDRLGARSLSLNLTARRNRGDNEQKTVDATTFASGRQREDQASTQYSGSWRASLNWSIADWVRLRTTRSVDTRSPSSRELFSSITSASGGFGFNSGFVNNPWRDPAAGGSTTRNEDSYGVIRGSNENLENEESSTNSLGLVFSPGGWARGLQLSFDYSELTVTGGISYSGFGGQGDNAGISNTEERPEGYNFLPYTIWRCYNDNDPFWCGKITFNPLGSPDEPNVDDLDPLTSCSPAATAPNNVVSCVARTDIVAWEDTPFNSEPYWTRNLDVSASYNFSLDGGGSLSVRLLGTHALEQSRCTQTQRSPDGLINTCLTRLNVVGITGQNSFVAGGNGGSQGFTNFTSQPTWAGNLYASYQKNAFTITGQARYTGKGVQQLAGLDPGDEDFCFNCFGTWYELDLPSWTTFNLTTGYNFARSRFAPERFENLQLSLTIDNLFDKQPDFYSCDSCTGGVNTRFYSGNGRTFRLNLRSAF